MKKVISLLFIGLIVCNCKKGVNVPLSFDFGSIENGIYDNTFFKFKFPVNPDWYILDNNETDRLYEIGNEVASGDNESLKKTLDASQINLAKLFTAFREQPGTNISFNPSIIINAENLKNSLTIKTNSDYLIQAKKLLAQTQMQIEFIEEKDKVKIGSQNFGFIKLENTLETGEVVTQDYYYTLKEGFVLLIIMSYVEDEGKTEVYNMFNKLKI